MMQNARQPLVLLTEDNALIGLNLRDGLEEAGYRVVGPVGRASDALLCLAQETPDFAILDVMLEDGPSDAVARELRRLLVPFLVHSGRHPSEALAQGFEGAPWLDKPSLPTAVIARLGQLVLAQPQVCPAPVTPPPAA